MDRSGICFADLQSLFAARRFKDVIAAYLQHLARELPDEIGIFSDQYGFASCRRKALVTTKRFRRSEKSRKVHFENRSLTFLAGRSDVAAALLNYSVNRREPQTCTF